MSKQVTFFSGEPTVFELARTDVRLKGRERPKRRAVFSLVDVTHGVVADAMIIDPHASWPTEFGPFWDWLDDGGRAPEAAEVSIPDASVLVPEDLSQVHWLMSATVLRRRANSSLHPVHEAAIDVLLGFPRHRNVPLRVEQDYFNGALHELQRYSLYEHAYRKRADLKYRPEVTYRQPDEAVVNGASR